MAMNAIHRAKLMIISLIINSVADNSTLLNGYSAQEKRCQPLFCCPERNKGATINSITGITENKERYVWNVIINGGTVKNFKSVIKL